jgi:hypothetical protein
MVIDYIWAAFWEHCLMVLKPLNPIENIGNHNNKLVQS